MSASSPDSGPYPEAAGHARMMPSTPDNSDKAPHLSRSARYSEWMTVREMLAELQRLPRDAELLAFEAGCEDYCEREVDEVEWQGGRVYLHLGARRDDPPGG